MGGDPVIRTGTGYNEIRARSPMWCKCYTTLHRFGTQSDIRFIQLTEISNVVRFGTHPAMDNNRWPHGLNRSNGVLNDES